MKSPTIQYLFLGLVLVLMTTNVHAETEFVTDKMQITFRTGPGNDRKILSLLSSGQSVEVLQREGEWSMVRLQNGKEGWVLQQYLTTEIPCRIQIKQVRQELAQLKVSFATSQNNIKKLESEKTSLTSELKSTKQELTSTQRAFEKLKKDAAGFLQLKARYDKTVKHLSAQTEKANTLDETLTKTLRKQNLRWFIGGASVLLIGFIIGFSTKKQKRHSSLL